ncbi:hypothetical protein B0H67DRAFT_334910 [Lasiosphaeris hirsuta]|uniref:Uncharacterized protein n=1 Tax=Lasiosphaeris hirsuta TaxID=260670 RepID=A0AA40A370_9PEZI|nr:hypothetical protein B0H67DRAFT_334910 [Lasiosphaeris hirsuta]
MPMTAEQSKQCSNRHHKSIPRGNLPRKDARPAATKPVCLASCLMGSGYPLLDRGSRRLWICLSHCLPGNTTPAFTFRLLIEAGYQVLGHGSLA